MKVLFNDENIEVDPMTSVLDIIEIQQLVHPFAIVINGYVIHSDKHCSTFIKSGDRIAAIKPMQGG